MRYSVITINFNNADGLRKTIQSVVSQTSNDYEYIIIDGGSSDGSVDVIKEYVDKIHYWVSERDKGIYNAMNKGIAQAHGDYCIFMNSGDIFYDSEVLANVTKAGYAEDVFVGRLLSHDEKRRELFAPPSGELTLYYLYSGTLAHQASFISTKLLRKFPYDESLKIVSDWKFYVQAIILENCSFRFIPENVALFDMEGVSTSNPEKTWKEKESVLNSLFPKRVMDDYMRLKKSECLSMSLMPQLRAHYSIDRLIFQIGSILLKIVRK
ncbi:MAG: glycosyltransferase [Bacteroidaceae bacterium]|nr:glycosyltransferase [Bacteroidaceae bacterium]